MGIKAMSRRALIFASILLVAGMVAAFYLAGASGRYVTGQVLTVDGGMVM